MPPSTRNAPRAARLNCEPLEDRVTPALAYALTGAAPGVGNLLAFDTATPATTTTLTIAGVTAGETLVGIDYRPATGVLYGLGVNPTADTGTLYTFAFSGTTATASPVGAAGQIAFVELDGTTAVQLPDPATTPYGFDFNPAADRVRVVAGTLNFRANPVTGAPVDGEGDGVTAPSPATGINTDGPIAPGSLSGAAYTNNSGVTTVTTLYTLDANTNTLYIQNPPNQGTQTMPLAVSVDFGAVNGFDIPEGINATASNAPVAGGSALAVLTVGSTTGLYAIDLTTGAATLVGPVGNGTTPVQGFSLATSVVSFQSPLVTKNEGPNVTVVLTRTGGSAATTATVNVTGGTATPGTDFVPGPYTVTFAAGQTTATLTIPFFSDGVSEPPETLVLTITALTNGAIGLATTTVTVNDAVQRFKQVFGTGSAIPVAGATASGSNTVSLLNPYPNTTGGVRVALGDVNGDGLSDLITVPSLAAPLVRVFSGADGSLLASFLAYPANLNIPATVAAGDLNNDGFAEIVLGTATTVGVVLVFDGRVPGVLQNAFLPFGSAPVGLNVAVGDTDGDGNRDIIVGTATGLAAVGVFDGRTFAQKQIFLPFGLFAGGATVAAGDTDGDGTDEIIIGTANFVPAVGVFSGTTQQNLFLPFGAAAAGANVAATDTNGDGRDEVVVGLATGLAVVSTFDGASLALVNTLLPFGGFFGGVFVG